MLNIGGNYAVCFTGRIKSLNGDIVCLCARRSENHLDWLAAEERSNLLTGIIERRRKAFERMVLLGNATLPLRRVCTMLRGGAVCVKCPRKGNVGHGGVVVKAT